MDQTSISRFNSRSTKGLSDDNVNGTVSRIFSPLASPEDGYVASPTGQMPDNKQWLDLDVLSPKLVKELRRQYDPSIKDEPHGPLGKGAAKIKAFVRQTKLGFDIRLRRKLNADHDEVTDIHLVPNSTYLEPEFRNEKQTSIAELPAMQNEINELPDSSTPQEMDAAPAPSRTSTGSSIREPLPRYEPRNDSSSCQMMTTNDDQERGISPDLLPVMSHHMSASQSSIIATPARGLSFRDPEDCFSESDLLSASMTKTGRTSTLDNLAGELLTTTVEEPPMLLLEKPQITKSLQAILATLDPEPATIQDRGEKAQPKKSAEEMFGPFKIAKQDIYETETDADPPSPISRKPARTSRRPAVVVPKRKKSYIKAKKKTADDVDLPTDSDEEGQPKINKLLRRQTIPKREPASSGVEALWSSLIGTQSKILGAEHPLVYQAKSDLAHSRANSHASGSQNLTSLTRSKSMAVDTLGDVHPWVATFTEDLATLQSLLGTSPDTHVADRSENEWRSNHGSSSSDAQNGVSARSEERKIEDVRTDSGDSSSPLPVESGEESRKDSSPPVFTDPVGEKIHSPELVTMSSDKLASSNARPELPKITTSLYSNRQCGSTADYSASRAPDLDNMWNAWRSPHKPSRGYAMLSSLAFAGLLQVTMNAIQWLQYQYGPEKPVESGKVRVRWTCSCGEQLYDDFVEQRRGAAREMEAYLNRPRVRTPAGGGSPTSPGSSHGNYSFGGSSLGMAPSSQTSWSSYGAQGQGSIRGNGDTKPQQTSSGLQPHSQYSPFYEPPWLLTCANEDRYASKVSHLDMAPHKITSDKELAKSLREHYYFTINKKWWRNLRIRGLTTIEFVQFELHQNRFADIRKCPDMPSITLGDYTFEPADLLPPVGSRYLLHLFKHPEDYDGEMITYLRAPKRNGRLQFGVGWGINLVEGFLADRVWILVSGFFALASVVFAITWELKKHDVQGASGVASWILSFTILVVGWLEASLG